MTGATLDRLIELTRTFDAERGGTGGVAGPDAIVPDSAVCQDLFIYGIGVDDYVSALEDEFGPVVREIPWLTYTDQTSSFRGCGIAILPFWLIYRLARKLVKGGPVFPGPDPFNHPHRLTLREIAEVIDQGAWPSDREGTA